MELFKVFGRLALNGQDEFNEGLDDASSKGSNFASKLGNGLKTMAKVGAAAITATATGIAALTKSSIDSYAEYEQLVGGVETLFGAGGKSIEEYAQSVGKSVEEAKTEYDKLMRSQNAVMENAATAYKDAGMSANEYMNTVTSFSASLLQGLGGDTEKAAAVANVAITDMSDNANKMGTDMGLIQNAYQGFAKQNYTMLDNLKLGYGGTASEMARLINESGVLGDSMTVTANTVNEVSFDKIIEAIHVVQDNMGITGTTANEAASTIQGSIGMMKSAWENFMTGMADPEQDFSALMKNLVDSVVAVADNLIPRLIETLPRLIEGLSSVVQAIVPYIPDIIADVLPALIKGATTLLSELVNNLPTILETLLPGIGGELGNTLASVLTMVTDGFEALFPALLTLALELLPPILDLINELMPIFAEIGETVMPVIVDVLNMLLPPIVEVVSQLLPPLLDMLIPLLDLLEPIIALLQPILDLVTSILEPLAELITGLLTPLVEIITKVIEVALVPLQAAFTEVASILSEVVNFAIQSVMDRVEAIKGVFSGIIQFIKGVFTGDWKSAWEGVKNVFSSIAEGIGNAFKTPINFIIGLINSFIKGINAIKIPDWVPAVGGKGINIPLIPKLEEGGILEKGQIGFLEGNGAEAVVPLDQNRKWISAVAADMNATIESGNSTELQELKELFKEFVKNLPEMMVDALSTMKFDVNNREFARMVKAVG